MKVADKWFQHQKIDDRITLIKEPYVSAFAQCNIWHIKGRDRDLLIDAGMGISSLCVFFPTVNTNFSLA